MKRMHKHLKASSLKLIVQPKLSHPLQNLNYNEIKGFKKTFHTVISKQNLHPHTISINNNDKQPKLSSGTNNCSTLNLLEYKKWTTEEVVSSLTIEELYLLKSLSQLELNNKNTNLFDEFKFTELRNREDTKEQIKSIAKRHFNVYNRDIPINKQEIFFMNAIGGSGSGKSRILKEMSNILMDASNDGSLPIEFRRSELIYFNFTNGFNIERGSKRDESYISMISARIAYSVFGEPGKYWASKLPKIVDESFFSEFMKIISDKLHEKNSSKELDPITLIIAFDEFQRATRAFPNLGHDVQHLIGYYCRKYQRRDRLIILPVFGGTLLNSDIPFYPTDHSYCNLNLPCFREQDTKAILTSEGLSDYYNSNTRLFWNVIGMVPRHLEWAIKYFNEFNKDSLEIETMIRAVYQSTLSQVSKFYTDYWIDDIEYLANLTLSGFAPKWQKFTKSRQLEPVINQLIGTGALYLYENGLYLPLLYINSLNNPTVFPNGVLDDFIKMSFKSECEKLEELTLKTLVCKFNMLFYYEKTDNAIIFSQVFDGAHYPRNLEKNIVKVVNSTFFTYSTSNSPFDYSLAKNTENVFTKAPFNQEGIAGYGSMIKIEGIRTVSTICKVNSGSDLTPENIVEIYEKAKQVLKNKPSLIIIVSSGAVSETVIEMIKNGKIDLTDKKSVNCPNLVVISGDCFEKFFNTFIGCIVKE